MNALEFGIEVITLSASGVLAPGPLFFANIAYGAQHDKWSGIKVAYGHTIVELPLIIILAAGLMAFDTAEKYADVIGVIGGIAILAFAGLQIANIFKGIQGYEKNSNSLGSKGPIIGGLILSALNPFFVLWWFTVGLKLVVDSEVFGVVNGITILFALHIWMDYAWLGSTAYLASIGASVLSSKYYPALRLGLTVVLIYYGVSFVSESA
ncbi:MAG: LysE family translocator [Thermoproteota archaeon]|nr:LysE family translocator [Thermoproteota archaeon]